MIHIDGKGYEGQSICHGALIFINFDHERAECVSLKSSFPGSLEGEKKRASSVLAPAASSHPFQNKLTKISFRTDVRFSQECSYHYRILFHNLTSYFSGKRG